jgi:hypothetical protein
MEPGSGGEVFTGQLLFFNPTVMAFTSARLSFLVRPFTEGTVTGGSLDAESLPTLDAVLEAVPVVAGVDEADPTPWGTTDAIGPADGGISSTPGVGRASLPAAQAREAMRANEVNTGIDDDPLKTYCISSIEESLVAGGKSESG